MTTSAKPAHHANDQAAAIGTHWLVDLSRVAPATLAQPESLMTTLRSALTAAGITILDERTHSFTGGGFTGFFLLAESHAAIHTYPEHGYAALDLFTCGAADGKSVVDAVIATCERCAATVRTFTRSRTQTRKS